MITGIVAEPGVGKSAFAMWLARCVMTGQPWFTGRKGPQPSQVLWCATENDMANTLGRMSQWKIPKHKLLLPFKDPLATINLSDPKHLKRMEQIIRQEQIKLVGVFDPQAIPASRGGHWP